MCQRRRDTLPMHLTHHNSLSGAPNVSPCSLSLFLLACSFFLTPWSWTNLILGLLLAHLFSSPTYLQLPLS